MTLLAGSPVIDPSPPALTDISRRAPDREWGPRNQAWTPPSASCLRCGGLLVLSYMASLESDLSGRPPRRDYRQGFNTPDGRAVCGSA
jgi:hypothetical protein